MNPDKCKNEQARQLLKFAEAYPIEAFPEVTDEERKEHGGLITRNSAAFGRHIGRVHAIPAAKELERMEKEVRFIRVRWGNETDRADHAEAAARDAEYKLEETQKRLDRVRADYDEIKFRMDRLEK